MAEILNTDILTILSQKNDKMLRNFTKTVSITLARLALIDPVSCSEYLPIIIKPWCLALRYISDG